MMPTCQGCGKAVDVDADSAMCWDCIGGAPPCPCGRGPIQSTTEPYCVKCLMDESQRDVEEPPKKRVWVEDGNDGFWSDDMGPCECTDHGARGAMALETRNGVNVCGSCALGNHRHPDCPGQSETPPNQDGERRA